MILNRRFNLQIYEGQLSGVMSDNTKILELGDGPETRKPVGAVTSTGGGQISAAGSYTLPLPDSYTNASYLHVAIVTEDYMRVLTTSPNHAASTVLLHGTATCPAVHIMTEQITTIVLQNPHATDACRFCYSLAKLPDITDEDSFFEMQDDGNQVSL